MEWGLSSGQSKVGSSGRGREDEQLKSVNCPSTWALFSTLPLVQKLRMRVSSVNIDFKTWVFNKMNYQLFHV